MRPTEPAVALAYLCPEEIEFAGPSATADMLERLGCDGAALTYHPARLLLPRFGAVRHTPPGTCSFEPRRSAYDTLVPTPTAQAATVRAVHAFREELARRGIAFHAWLAVLHTEPLARLHPQFAAQTLDGKPTVDALCPSHADVRRYGFNLVTDICDQFAPEGLKLEAVLEPSWLPSYTISLELETLTQRARPLVGQCFCRACRAELVTGGSDPDFVLQETRAPAGPPFAVDCLLQVDPPAALAALRAEVAARMLAAVADAAHSARSRVRALLFGEPQEVELQGAAPSSLSAVDSVGIGMETATGEALRAHFLALGQLAGAQDLAASLNWSPARSPADFAADVDRVVEAGARAVALYNLSLTPTRGLDAFAAAARASREALSRTLVPGATP